MVNNWFISAGLFSPGQIAAIVIVSVLLAAAVGVNIWLIFLIRKRGAHKMYNEQMNKQREALMNRLAAMRAGAPAERSGFTFPMMFGAYGKDEEKAKAEEAAEAAEIAEEEKIAETADEADEVEEEDLLDLEIVENGRVVRYDRSYTARIIQSDNDLKGRYSELKNYIMSYKGMRSRISWKKEIFHIGRKNIASFVVRGKTLCICLATDPKMFDGTKYKVDDLSLRSKKNKMPCRFRITSDRKTYYAKELVDIVAAGFGIDRTLTYTPQDYTLPYKSTEALVKRRLIKVLGDSIPDFAKEDALAAAKRIHYNRSFEARIIQCDEELKGYYSTLKNYLLSYSGVSVNNTWKKETYTANKRVYAVFVIRGKTLCLCLALDPQQFVGTKYNVENLGARVKNTKTSTLFRVKSARKINYAKQLIDKMFAETGIPKTERQDVNYVVPFTSTDTLVRRGLIKVVTPSKKKEENADVPYTDGFAGGVSESARQTDDNGGVQSEQSVAEAAATAE